MLLAEVPCDFEMDRDEFEPRLRLQNVSIEYFNILRFLYFIHDHEMMERWASSLMSSRNRNSRPTILIRHSYREGGKVKKRTLANIPLNRHANRPPLGAWSAFKAAPFDGVFNCSFVDSEERGGGCLEWTR